MIIESLVKCEQCLPEHKNRFGHLKTTFAVVQEAQGLSSDQRINSGVVLQNTETQIPPDSIANCFKSVNATAVHALVAPLDMLL